MKKFLYPLLGLSALFASCDMKMDPKNAMNQEDAMTEFQNLEYYRNGFYSSLRGRTAGSYISTAAMQGDEFIGIVINGNRLGSVNNGDITSSTGDVTGFFGSMYSAIADANYFFPYAEAMLNEGLDSEEDMAQLKRYVAEAKFLRAYAYWFLLDHYCGNYTPENGDTPALGLPLVEVYNPTPLTSMYPGRSTLNETYAFIERDLKDAYDGLKEFEENYSDIANEEMLVSNASYLSTYAVRALQARLALLKGDWQAAYDYADDIVSSRKYRLTQRRAYANIWISDTGTEIIFRPFANSEERTAVPETSLAWLSTYEDKADYIATANALAIYDEGDTRLTDFFAPREVNCFSVEVIVPSFIKFPGNKTFNATANSVATRNMPKPFRTSEQVLIMAEAADKLGMTTEANEALNDLRTNRIDKWKKTEYSGRELTEQIRLERQRELIGEGFRISDLRRWGLEATRSLNYEGTYSDAASVTVVGGRDVSYSANDYRYVWPIPASEFLSNPQLKGQQNPLY